MRFASTTRRASSSWRVIELKDSVSTPSSSRLVTGAWRLKSPRATACVAWARLRERFGQPVGQQHRKRDRHQQRHRQREGERHDVDALQSLARERELAIVAIGRLDRLGAFAELIGHRLAQLQEARLVGQARLATGTMTRSASGLPAAASIAV